MLQVTFLTLACTALWLYIFSQRSKLLDRARVCRFSRQRYRWLQNVNPITLQIVVSSPWHKEIRNILARALHPKTEKRPSAIVQCVFRCPNAPIEAMESHTSEVTELNNPVSLRKSWLH